MMTDIHNCQTILLLMIYIDYMEAPCISELTPNEITKGLTHLGSEASIYPSSNHTNNKVCLTSYFVVIFKRLTVLYTRFYLFE